MPDERFISGLQLGLVDKPSRSIGEWVELLGKVYVEATVDGALELGLPARKFPTIGSAEWLDLSPRPLPLSKTRFSIPAFVYLNYRFLEQDGEACPTR